MRSLLLTLLLVAVSGCHKNHDELSARQAELELRLANLQARADNLNEERKALEALELALQSGLAEFPEARAQLAAIQDEPVTVAPLPALPPLPPESVFEGSEGAHQRRRISDTEARIAQLGKILGELDRLTAEKKKLQRKVALLNELRAQRK